ncbi:hypothetical protein [Halorubrum tebenquichense]|uniref:DUF8112 domain-containing protein n=1 Tax=Halorubrum tebenquichense DSM 14210 TaxID=1227485 RepID=M0DKN1_9EURY|nr:hypothetical protein [Halorubrum tebenquichense]ELZ35378.1 hypothetical protein C472_12610 [Halorubrum tebenquichense DSM 14210]
MTTFKATPEQILNGESLTYGGSCTLTCSATGETLREGYEVVVHVDRHQSIDAWGIVGVYGVDARNVELHGKRDHDEILARGRLAVASDCATQEAALIFRVIDILNTRHVGDSRDK